MESTKLLRSSIDAAMAKYPPKIDKKTNEVLETYCNWGCRDIARAMGCSSLDGLTANQIADKLPKDWAFAAVDGVRAQALAVRGNLVLGVCKGSPHGHVAAVYPTEAPMLSSGKWGKEVPWVGNVGKENKVMGANFAFRTEPAWYAFIKDPDKGPE